MAVLSAKQRLFCVYQARMDNPAEAAIRAGYLRQTADAEARQLLRSEAVRAEIERGRSELRGEGGDAAIAGLMRLATGGIGDVAKLVCADTTPGEEALASMDLFAVSELRKNKDGGLEVKLYDRLQAFKLLLDYHGGEREGGSLYSALDAAVSGMSGPPPAGGGPGRE